MKSGINLILGTTQKKYSAQFDQLKVRHAAVGVFLKQIVVSESENCWCCKVTEQSAYHVYTMCKK